MHRWFGYARTVSAHAETFVKQRPLSDSDGVGPVDRPDTVNILCEMENGAQAAFLFTYVARLGADPHGMGPQIEAYGSDGTLIYRVDQDALLGGKASDGELSEIPIPQDEVREWTVEQDFVDAIRTGKPAETTFYQGVKYMEFTEAVFRSVESGGQVRLPLVD
jgi:hypothetical protein